MIDIRDYIDAQLIGPLKRYRTTIGDTLLTIIKDRLAELYEYTVRFPEIVSPNASRWDILQAIIEQFQFKIREEADIQEQIDILENILHVYSKRGSVDTIENMWKYYGGDLPKDIKIKIPSYNLFRYNISKFSGTDVYQDSDNYRSGVYEVVLNNSNYPIPKLKEFLLSELVAAGNRIYFTNSLYSLLTGKDSAYKYDVQRHQNVTTNLRLLSYRSGMGFSGAGSLSQNSKSSIWSGRPDLFFEIARLLDIGFVQVSEYKPLGFETLRASYEGVAAFLSSETSHVFKNIQLSTFYTPVNNLLKLERYLYDINGDLINSPYPGYFILGETLLGNEVE